MFSSDDDDDVERREAEEEEDGDEVVTTMSDDSLLVDSATLDGACKLDVGDGDAFDAVAVAVVVE